MEFARIGVSGNQPTLVFILSMRTLALIIIPILLLTPTMVMATTPYQAGYAHGVSDEKTNGTLYITQGKGFASHTKEFNQGYIDGYCSLQSTS
jgi:hypothetical protein